MNDFKDKDLWDELRAYKIRVESVEALCAQLAKERDEATILLRKSKYPPSPALMERILKYTREEIAGYYATILTDTCETDTYIRNTALKVLPDFDVNGNSFHVPPVEEIVDILVARIQQTERDRDEWRRRFMELADVVAEFGSCGMGGWCPETREDCEKAEDMYAACKSRILAHYKAEET